jgi:DNA-binding HxlR family transcriptional regulator
MQVILYFCSVNKKKIIFRSDCPMATALDIIGDRWSLLIVRDMVFRNKNTYGDFLNGQEKIATNILADRLALLESGEIISKHKHPDSKAKVLYRLTPKGIDLIPLLLEIVLWSEKHHDVHPHATAIAQQAKKDRTALVKQLRETAAK